MKVYSLFSRSSASLALAALVFLPGSLGQDKKPDRVKVTSIELKGIYDRLDNLSRLDEKILEHILSTNDTPIKVRGGAMTFVADKWTYLNKGVCTDVKVNDSAVVEVEGFDAGLPDSVLDPIAYSLPATILLYGGNAKHGVKIVPDKNFNCDQSTGQSITITPFGDGEDDKNPPVFYPSDLANDPTFPIGSRHYRRYMDNTCQPKNPDEDLCERMTAIAIVPIGSTTIKSPFPVKCRELDCTVKIGMKKAN